MLKKFPSNKISGTKNDLCSPSRAPTYHSFTQNLRFLSQIKHKVGLSKTVLFLFLFNKMYGLFDFKTT